MIGRPDSRSIRSVLNLGFTALLAGACAGHPNAPVTDRTLSLRQTDAEFREVIAGDTLYSIAWESGHDYRDIATWNHISPPYTIKPGQKIRLQPPATANANAPADSRNASSYTVQRGDTLFSIATRYDVPVADLASWNGLATPFLIKPGQSLRLTDAGDQRATKSNDQRGKPTTRRPPTTHSTMTSKAVAARKARTATASVGTWSWPADGAVISRFNKNGSKGIDIAGNAGYPVVAAAPGTVVYQGSGLRGYGQLIIIKHNTDFLSAYAHCDKIVVREGNVIKRGQKIAEMGSTGTDRVKLHFEIRYRGTPVDPLDHLPKK